MSNIFISELLSSMKEHSIAYYSVIQTFFNNRGYINKKHSASFTRCPVEKLEKHITFSTVIGKLLSSNIISPVDTDIYKISEKKFSSLNYSEFKAKELAVKIITEDFYRWSRNINLVAYNSGKTFFDNAVFSKFQWCFSAPSYITGVKRDGKQGVIVADVLIDKYVTEDDVDFFIPKINTIKKFKNHINFIPIFIVISTSIEAFEKLKRMGVVILTIRNWLGKDYEMAITNLIILVSNAEKIVKKNPEKYLEYLDSICKIESKSGNMKGVLFELSVYYHLSKDYPNIELNKFIKNPGNESINEIDIYCSNGKEIRIIECKGSSNKLDIETVKKWLNETIYNIWRHLLNTGENSKNITFELWSTGGFSEDALNLLYEKSKIIKKYNLKYYDKKSIYDIARDRGNKHLSTIIMNFF